MERLARWIRPWATSDGPDALDSLVMEARDRLANLGFFAAAAVVWLLVGLVVTTRDPVVDPSAGFIGAVLIGLAVAPDARPDRLADGLRPPSPDRLPGDWLRAIRRRPGSASSSRSSIVLRLQGLLELPIALFIIALVVVAEATLSAER